MRGTSAVRRECACRPDPGASPMPTKQKTLDDLFLETLKDMYHAEKQILRALPKMGKAADSDQLRQAFETHRKETEGQVARLEQVFEMLGKPARGKPCEAIQGIIEEGKEVMTTSRAQTRSMPASLPARRRSSIMRFPTTVR